MNILLSNIVLFAICAILLSLAVNATENKGKNRSRNHNRQDFKIRPNLNDINQHFQKTVKPYIDHPFIPMEVDQLEESKKVDYKNISMSAALLVGKKNYNYGGKKEIEKPIMYSTIVQGHPTVIRHPTPQPQGLGVSNDTAKAFALSDEATKLAEQMKKGSYSVPVKLESQAGENDSLEVPNFIQSKETLLKGKKSRNMITKEVEPKKFLKDSFNSDAKLLLDNLENKKDKAERITALIQGKKRLEKDALAIQQTIAGRMKELLFAKEVALKLTNLNNYYTTQIKRTKLSGLKLSEVISVKKLLREKIMKEVQGLRTASADYADLDKINKADVELVMKKINFELKN